MFDDEYWYEETRYQPDFWCLFKVNKYDSIKLAKIIWRDAIWTGVKEYGYGEYSHTIPTESIMTRSTDYKMLKEILRTYEMIEDWEKERFKCVKVYMEI
jgi:hypothetical protein